MTTSSKMGVGREVSRIARSKKHRLAGLLAGSLTPVAWLGYSLSSASVSRDVALLQFVCGMAVGPPMGFALLPVCVEFYWCKRLIFRSRRNSLEIKFCSSTLGILFGCFIAAVSALPSVAWLSGQPLADARAFSLCAILFGAASCGFVGWLSGGHKSRG